MEYSAPLVAYAFVKKGIENNMPVTQMQLQKMVYFAHGYHLATTGDALVSEAFEAWTYGPVVPSIYRTYRLYGSSAISDPSLISRVSGITDVSKLDSEAWEAVNYAWEATKNLSGIRLSNWSHDKDGPWFKHFKPGAS